MKNDYIRKIINNYIDFQYDEAIQDKFRRWLVEEEDAIEKERFLLEIWSNINPDTDESIFEELAAFHQLVDSHDREKKSKLNFGLLLQIASVILIVSICSFATYYLTKQSVRNIEMVECFVENGKQKQIILPDNSSVWLNSGSLLIYPNNFRGDNRTVFLNGEAIFSIATDHKKPFIVKTNRMDIKALGTVFNVKAYSDMPRATASLQEGSIAVNSKTKNEQEYILKPNEQVAFDAQTGKFTKEQVDADRILSWKDGYLVFERASLSEILHAISKKYNMLILYNEQLHTEGTYTIRFSPSDNLIQSLNILKEIVSPFRYEIEGHTIHVY